VPSSSVFGRSGAGAASGAGADSVEVAGADSFDAAGAVSGADEVAGGASCANAVALNIRAAASSFFIAFPLWIGRRIARIVA